MTRPADRCPHCQATTVRALDDTWCATIIEIDPVPITAHGEVLAWLAGRRTVTAEAWGGGTPRLTRRGPHQIRSRPAGTFRGDVYATHTCWATPLPAAPTAFTKPPDPNPDTQCPY